MSDWSGWLGGAAAAVAKGAAAGSIVPGIGTGVGAAIGLASDLVPELAGLIAGKPDLAAQVAQTVQDVAGDAGALVDPDKLGALRLQLAQIAATEKAAQSVAQVEQFKAAVADMANARAHDVQVRAGSDGRNTRADVMLAITVAGIVLSLAVALLGKLDGNSAVFGLVAGLVGLFSKCFSDAFAFEFGSSRGSKAKDVTIATMASSNPGS